MPIQVIEPRRLYVQIADQVRSLIASGEFSPGSRLPAERELAKRFGVSRPSMREALIALEVEGYVDVRPGSGIMVTTPTDGAPACSGDDGPLEIMRARILIEGAIAAEAAGDMTPKDLAALEQMLFAMEDPATGAPAWPPIGSFTGTSRQSSLTSCSCGWSWDCLISATALWPGSSPPILITQKRGPRFWPNTVRSWRR